MLNTGTEIRRTRRSQGMAYNCCRALFPRQQPPDGIAGVPTPARKYGTCIDESRPLLACSETPLLRNILVNLPLYRELDAQQLSKLSGTRRCRCGHEAPHYSSGAIPWRLACMSSCTARFGAFSCGATVRRKPWQLSAMAGTLSLQRLSSIRRTFQRRGRFQTGCSSIPARKRSSTRRAKTRLSPSGFLLQQSAYQSGKGIEIGISKTLIASKPGTATETFSRLLQGFSSRE